MSASIRSDRTCSLKFWLLLLLVGIIAVRMASLGLYPLMDTTEARYAEMSRKMIETGLWLYPQFDYGEPFWGKPPLAFWAGAASMSLFGINEFGARMAAFFFALLTMGLFFAWPHAREREAERAGTGLAACLIFLTSGLGFVASGAVMTDMALTFATSLCMVAFAHAVFGRAASFPWRWLFFVGLALGLLAKGPVAVVLSLGGVGLWTLCRGNLRQTWTALPWLRGLLLTLALAAPWYVLVEMRTPGFLDYFFLGEHWARFTVPGWQGDLYGSAHQEPLASIWLYALFAALPWSLILPALWLFARWRRAAQGASPQQEKTGPDAIFPDSSFLICSMLTPLLLFTFARNILPAYVLPGLPAFALLAARQVERMTAAMDVPHRVWWVPAGCVALLLLALPLVLPIMAQRSQAGLLRSWDPATSLVYLEKRPFSGQFYSGGKAKEIKTPEETAAWLEEGSGSLAVRESSLRKKALPLPPAWIRIASSGDWLLFRNDRAWTAQAKEPFGPGAM